MILEIWSYPVEKLFSEGKNGNKKFGGNFGCPHGQTKDCPNFDGKQTNFL